MTEYDYSPEAYERYITKQQSIARWVERQSQEAPRYANPFLPSENGEPERPHLLNNDDRRRSVTRSFSTPIDARHNSPSPARHHHRSHSNANGGKVHTMHLYSAQHSSTPTLVQQDGSHSHGSRSHSHSRSSSRAHPRPPPSRSQNYAANNPAFTASQTQLHRSGSHRSHGSSTAHHTLQYASTPGQPVIMQRGKQTYVVVPSRGGHVEVRVRKITTLSFTLDLDLMTTLFPFPKTRYSHLTACTQPLQHVGRPLPTLPILCLPKNLRCLNASFTELEVVLMKARGGQT